MATCNDLTCLDRTKPKDNPCVNNGCSHSSYQNKHELRELITSVIITKDCSSQMVKKIEQYKLAPSKFKIDKWTNLN